MPRNLRESRHDGTAHGGGGIHKALTRFLARGVSAYGLEFQQLGQQGCEVKQIPVFVHGGYNCTRSAKTVREPVSG